MLHPELDKVGMGLIAGNATLDTLTHLGRGSFPAYAFPPDGAVTVPVTWSCGEGPSPIGGDPMGFTEEVARRYGYPITLTFDSADVREVGVVLRPVGGEPLELHVSSPEAPAQPSHPANMNSIFLMSKRPLAPKTAHEVTIRCLHDAQPFEKRWTFTTK